MSTPHYVAFVGIGSGLADELRKLQGRISGFKLVAPPVKTAHRGVNLNSLRVVHSAIAATISRDGANDSARLSVWAYDTDVAQKALLWDAFGRSAWVEYIPRSTIDNIPRTLTYVEQRLAFVASSVHEISHQVLQKRRASPLVIPFRNFKSKLLTPLTARWYDGLDRPALVKKMRSLTEAFRQRHTRSELPETYYHEDERGLRFAPAKPEICHAKPHPIGDNDRCYVDGRFRYGAALFPGFHYDVREQRGNLRPVLHECCGTARNVASENIVYINIYPNDHLLPAKGAT
jgi:hypothetical protein